MSDSHIPWAEQDGDGMWEPSCYVCGVLAGPPFNVMLQRYNTEEEAFAAANSILSVLPHSDVDHSIWTEGFDCFAMPTSFQEQEPQPLRSRREQVLMDSQKAWLRRLDRTALWVICSGLVMVLMCVGIIDKNLVWSLQTIALTAMVCTVPLLGLGMKSTIEERMREVEKQ